MTVDTIIRAAQRGIDEDGLDITIAELAGVGRRIWELKTRRLPP